MGRFSKKIRGVLIAAMLCLFFSTEVRAGIAEEQADYYQADEIVGFVHRPYAQRTFNWPEYHKGKLSLRTNNLGFREDADTDVEKKEDVIRVLMTGDSHIDGILDNSESFPNVLETLLNARAGKPHFEIINGGTGLYGPDEYFLFLKKFLFLKPDIYVVIFYSGNDFLDASRTIEARDGENRRPSLYFQNLRRCSMGSTGAVWQVMNQAYYFKTFPAMKEQALRHVLERFTDIDVLCRQEKIRLMVVVLPTKADMEWQSDQDALARVQACLALNNFDLMTNRKLTEQVLKGLVDRGITAIDFYDLMKNQNDEFFWKGDYHLNDRGHRFLAETIYRSYSMFFSFDR